MPRRSQQRNITGQRRRDNIRQAVQNLRSPNEELEQLVETCTYKIALTNARVQQHSLGEMLLKCQKCGALHFKDEQKGRGEGFSSCCHKGKVNLPPYRESHYIQSLLNGANHMSKNYKDNIRSYNSALAMVSTQAKIEEHNGGGPFMYKVHDTMYHSIGTLQPSEGNHPTYAQIYIYDVETAVQERMLNKANGSCSTELMYILTQHLVEINPYAQVFRMMSSVLQNTPTEQQKELRMHIVNDRAQDQRRYNDATSNDVAIIFRANDGEPPSERDLIIYPKDQPLRRISILHSCLDPMAYPLLFPYGDEGWHTNMKHSDEYATRQRTSLTMLQYASYRLAIRETFSTLHRSEKLFLQWIVDIYVRIEGSRLDYIRKQQGKLRAESYLNIMDYLHQRVEHTGDRLGKMIILPSSFIGSPRNMQNNYHDAMAIVRQFGKPDIFITFTCNPKWPEITSKLEPGEKAHFRPELIVRVFHEKLKSLINDINKKNIFGKVSTLIYTIEFQKRGLPHCHMLISLASEDKLRDSNKIDSTVCAELPDKNADPLLFQRVTQHMIHGPCGPLNTNAPCMRERDGNLSSQCCKHIPKEYAENTRDNLNGYPVYRRRNTGVKVSVRGGEVDNSFVVPYNPYLLRKYNAHINVEVCTTVKSVKYIYKYIYKGYDACTVIIAEEGTMQYDEVASFLNARYVGSTEAAWRIFENKMHYQSHTVIKLDCHLENQQTVYFREGDIDRTLNPKDTKLQAWFLLNSSAESNSCQHLYTEIPFYFTWDETHKRWKPRQRGAGNIVTRLYNVDPRKIELFHLRLLLLHVRGAKSFVDLRTYDGIIYQTFREAAIARGVALDDSEEMRNVLQEAVTFKSAKQIRHLFAIILALNLPTNSLELWEEFKVDMIEDFARSCNIDEAENKALLDIQSVLETHNTNCEECRLPSPTLTAVISEFQPEQQAHEFDELYNLVTEEQRLIINDVLASIQSEDQNKLFYLDAPAGCGKTFVQRTIMANLRSRGIACLPVAFTGIAASLVNGGRTLHNAFKLPIPLNSTSVSNIKPNSIHAQYLNTVKLIILDEATMTPSPALTIIDRLLRDIAIDELDRLKPFGGKTFFMCGDFRQTLPVIPHSGRSGVIEACIKSHALWPKVKQMQLTRNLRVIPGEEEFATFLLNVGNDTLPPSSVKQSASVLPSQLFKIGTPVDFIYSSETLNNINSDNCQSAILCPLNEDCFEINNAVLEKVPGEKRIYLSVDSVNTDDASEQLQFPVEFLNSLEGSGLPRHRIALKIGALVMLMRNLNTRKGIINGTRLKVTGMYSNSIECEVLTGSSQGQLILIPKVKLSPSDSVFPFKLTRYQFPICVAYAITINKSQGQTFTKVALNLPKPVFSHGQLYVALSRAKSFDAASIFITETDKQFVDREKFIHTTNVVFKEML